MKKIISFFLVILLAFNITAVTFAIAPAYVQSVSILSEKAIVMRVGETITLNAVADAQGFNRAYMYWNTNDTDILNLIGDKGTTENTSLISTATVKAINPGKAVISVYSDMEIVAEPEDYYENDSVIINVVSADDSYVSTVEPDFIWYDMYLGDEISINAIAHTIGTDSAYFNWQADDRDIVEITGNNDTIPLSPPKSTVTVKALSTGLATISIYADSEYPQTYKSICSKIKINVMPKEDYPLQTSIWSLELKTDFEKTIYVGDEINLVAIAEQDDYRREWAYFTWSSDDDGVADVADDNVTLLCTPPISIGKIKGVSEGKAIVTVFAGVDDGEASIQESVVINVLPKKNDEYVVNFYNEIPPENSEESDYIYHKIENLQASDIVVFPEIPEKENYIFTGWKVQSGNEIYFAEPQPFTALNNNGKYYASWCLETEYEPIKIEISSSETITKGKENGKKITLKTNYGRFVEDTEFPTDWRTAYNSETDEQTKADILSEWKSKWNIIGNDDLIIETATRIDDKTVEFTLSGNSDDIYANSDIYIEFDNSLLMPEPYETNGEIIDWDDTKIKMDTDGVRAKMYCSDNALALSRQSRPSTGGGGGVSRYTVTFDTNGGSVISKQTVNRNATVKEPERPLRDEYNFVGWFTDKEFTKQFDFQAKITKSITLYAKWDTQDITKKQIVFTIGKTEATVFGEEKQNDVVPVIKGDRAFLPARFVAENLGALVEWDEDIRTVTVTKDDVIIVITIGAESAIAGGETIKLDYPAFIENDRTYTPIRFIAEKLGGAVDWNPDGQTVTITK